MKVNDVAVGTMRNIIMQSTTDQLVFPLDSEKISLDRVRPEYRAFVREAMGGRDSFDIRELDQRLAQLSGTLEQADGKGVFNLENRKYNEAELRWAAQRDPAVISFVELVKDSRKRL